MSSVYRAIDETLERPVAIKLMNREIASDSDQLERFRREARAVAQLSHPHIVGVIDEGETLKERIRRNGELDIAEAVAYAIDLPSDVLPTPGGPTRQRIGPFLPG